MWMQLCLKYALFSLPSPFLKLHIEYMRLPDKGKCPCRLYLQVAIHRCPWAVFIQELFFWVTVLNTQALSVEHHGNMCVEYSSQRASDPSEFGSTLSLSSLPPPIPSPPISALLCCTLGPQMHTFDGFPSLPQTTSLFLLVRSVLPGSW